jgi:hypothetical protein
MSFLFPAMLAGLVGMGVPIALHLIARHRFPVREFPSIRLLKKDLRTNVFAPKLVDVPQLILRLIVLGLLVLAMSRLFSSNLSTSAAPRNLIVVVDCSAGMRMEIQETGTNKKTSLLAKAKVQARQMIEKLEVPSQCAVILAEGQARVVTPLQADASAALRALENIETIDGPGCGIVRGVAAGCELVAGRREIASQIVVLTDMRANAFTLRDQKDLKRIEQMRQTLGASLQILCVDLSAGTELENVAIVETYVRGRNAKVGDDAHIVAKVVNSSSKQKTSRLRLQVGDRKEPLNKEVSLEPGAEAVVDMTARVQRAANTVASVHIAEDALSFDDSFSVPLNISDTRRVLIVNGASQNAPTPGQPTIGQLGGAAPAEAAENEGVIDGATILRYVLNPGRELGAAFGTGIDVTIASPEGLAAQTLSKYDIVVLYDVSSLAETAMDDLTTFVSEGRAALIVCSGGCQALSFNRTLATGNAKRPALSPALIGNEKVYEQPVDIQYAGSPHPVLIPFQDKLRGDLSIVRFTKLREIQSLAEGASTLLAASTGQTLAVEHAVGRGRVVMLTFGFELDRGNIARARVFPSFVWRLSDYMTGQLRQRPPDVLKAMNPAILDVSEPAFSFVSELDLVPEKKTTEESSQKESKATRLASSADKTILVPPLSAGRFMLTKASQAGASLAGYSRYVTTSIDPVESNVTKQDVAELSSLFGPDARVIEVNAVDNLALPGGEFWKWIVIVMAFAYFGEALSGYFLSKRRERQRAEENAA